MLKLYIFNYFTTSPIEQTIMENTRIEVSDNNIKIKEIVQYFANFDILLENCSNFRNHL